MKFALTVIIACAAAAIGIVYTFSSIYSINDYRAVVAIQYPAATIYEDRRESSTTFLVRKPDGSVWRVLYSNPFSTNGVAYPIFPAMK
jgi:hypothetical protein